LFAKDEARLHNLIHDWPEDIRTHVARLVKEAVRLEQEATDGTRPS
jgi:hypothetical protein